MSAERTGAPALGTPIPGAPRLALVRPSAGQRAVPGAQQAVSSGVAPRPAPPGAAWLPIVGRGCDGPRAWALVDVDLLPSLAAYRWRLVSGYPVRSCGRRTAQRPALHHLVLPPRAGVHVDHANGDRLDARRANLRYATDGLNQANRRVVRTTSGFKGVTRHRLTGRWQAAVKVGGHNFHLGLYDDPRDAARAYWHAAVALFGPYAWTNLPEAERPLRNDPVGLATRQRVRRARVRASVCHVPTWRTLAPALRPALPNARPMAPLPRAA